jgi:hypothetical protein
VAKGLGWAAFLAAWCVASLLALEAAPAAFAQSGTNPPETSNFEQSGSTAAPAPETSGGKGNAGPAQHPAKSANSPNFRQSGASPRHRERQQEKSTGLGGPAAPPGAEGNSNYRQSGNPEGK